MSWQPSASLATLQVRAAMVQRVRDYFLHQAVLEVEVPHLDLFANTDPNIASIEARCDGLTLYLQTSPEYCLKRLLARDGVSVFALARAYRDAEISARHNPEFTMLEWYRVGFDWRQLMDDVAACVEAVVGSLRVLAPAKQHSYSDVFETWLGINPHRIDDENLLKTTQARIDVGDSLLSRSECLELLFSYFIEPHLGADGLEFIYDYPACMAALAKQETNAEGVLVTRRFEAFLEGRELANGYQELTDAEEQSRRFAMDEARRHQEGKPSYRGDPRLVAALQHGLPECAGVALGFDRLVMAALGLKTIEQVLAFPLRPR